MKKPITTQKRDPHAFLLTDKVANLTPLTRIRLAFEAVQALDWSNPRLISPATQAFQPRMMLTLLTFCYTSGIHGSQQVVSAIRSNPMVRYICAHTYPQIEDVRRFRRENRAVLFQCLSAFYKLVQSLESDTDALEGESGLNPPRVPNRSPESQACHCIELASFIDLMEQDD